MTGSPGGPGLPPPAADIDRLSERIEAGLDVIEAGLARARAAAARRERGLVRLDAALRQLNELLGGTDGAA